MGDKNQFYTVRGYEILTKNKNLLTPSMEDYLEMIYRLYKTSDYIRIKTLAEQLNVRDSSVTKMVQKLAGLGLLEHEKYGLIALTDEGKELGKYLLHRHKAVETFLMLIGNEDIKLMDIEMMEHRLSPNIIEYLCILNDFFENNTELKQDYDNFKQKCMSRVAKK